MGDCIQKDKENEILNKILESDALIFASPVYYYNVSSQLKMMIDRFYAKTMQINNDNEFTYGAIDKYFDTIFSYMHFQDIGRIYGKGCGTVSQMSQKYYEDAYKLGRDI